MSEFTVIIPAYRRVWELRRLLESCLIACEHSGIWPHFVVSVDGGSQAVLCVLDDFAGLNIETVVHSVRLGLREHILTCGDLTSKFQALVVLEDDLVVSPEAWLFVRKNISFAKAQSNVASLSLYSFQNNEFGPFYSGTRFFNDAFFYCQTASSWGQVWWKEKWLDFRQWLVEEYDPEADYCVPKSVKDWPRSSWKKLFNFWLADRGYFTLFPRTSFALNTPGVDGTHMNADNTVSHSFVAISAGYSTPSPIDEAVCFDSFLEIITDSLPHQLALSKIPISEVEFDLACTKRKKDIRKPYVFTRRRQIEPQLAVCGNSGNLLLSLVLERPGKEAFLTCTDVFDECGPPVWETDLVRIQLSWMTQRYFVEKCTIAILNTLVTSLRTIVARKLGR